MRRMLPFVAVVVGGLTGVACLAQTAPVTFSVTADHADGLYELGEEAVFTVRCRQGGQAATSGVVRVRLDNFGETVCSSRRVDLATGSVFSVRGTLKEPGFLRLALSCELPEVVEKTFGSDLAASEWSVGYAPTDIRKGAGSPDDFDAFWAVARAKLAAEVPLDSRMEKVPERCTPEFDFYGISFATFGRRVHGLMSIPKAASATNRFPLVFIVPGAGCGGWSQDMKGNGREIRVFMTVFDWAPCWNDREAARRNYAELWSRVRAKWGTGEYSCAGLSGGRESYFYYPVILGLNRVVDWAASRPETDTSRVYYEGTSQGGMFGLILTGLNRRFTRAVCYVPAGCDLLGYKRARRSGWPRLVERQPSESAKAAAEAWAPYFDAANFSARIRIPIRFVFGFSDTVCPPASVWSAFNACGSEDKGIEGGVGMTHMVFDSLYRKYGSWLRNRN